MLDLLLLMQQLTHPPPLRQMMINWDLGARLREVHYHSDEGGAGREGGQEEDLEEEEDVEEEEAQGNHQLEALSI